MKINILNDFLQTRAKLETIKINIWVDINKLTINCRKSYFMIVENKNAAVSSFKLSINHNLIEETDSVKYLGVHLNNKLSGKIHIDMLACKLLKVCGVIYQLRHYVSFSTLKLVYYAMFHSPLQYSLINWGRAYKSHYHNLVILQNKILRASLFLPMHHPTNLLYTKFCVLKLDDVVKIELTKFMFKFTDQMLSNSFNNYFLRLDKIHKYNSRQKYVLYFTYHKALLTIRRTVNCFDSFFFSTQKAHRAIRRNSF